MRRFHRALLMLVLCLALATATTAVASAKPTPPTALQVQADQRRALYQSELEQNILLRTQPGYGSIVELGPLHSPTG